MTDWRAAVEGRAWIDVFVEQTERHAEREFARCGEETLSYGQLRERVDTLASGLLRSGVRPGETVALWMTNCLEFLVVQWATYRLGCTLLPLYSYFRRTELAHGLRDTRAVTLVTKRNFAGKADPQSILLEVLPELSDDEPQFAQAPHLRQVVTLEPWPLAGTRDLDDVLADGRPVERTGLDWIQARTGPLDVMHVMYTSGTTGLPKGGLSMHGNNMASMHLWGELAGLGAEDVILCHVPLFTNFGALAASALGLYHGSRLVVTEYFDARHSLELIERERVTYVPGTPEMFKMLLEDAAFAEVDTSSVRGAHVAGSALEPEVAERIIDELAPEAMQAYGMSECSGLSTATSAADPRWARIGTIGRPLAHNRVEIHDPTTQEVLPTGEVGEIWFGDTAPGSCVGKGYLGSPDETAAAITPQGWFRSGDLGRYDDHGYLHFAGRIKAMFTVGGFNVYPAEVERLMTAMDGVDGAYVVGVPDERLGTVPVAFLVADPDVVTDVGKQLASSLSSQKRPRALWAIRQEDVPMTSSGKVALAELQERARALISRELDPAGERESRP